MLAIAIEADPPDPTRPKGWNEDIAWYLFNSDAVCGHRSTFGTQLETLVKSDLRGAESLAEELRRNWQRDRVFDEMTEELGREPSPNELASKLFYLNKLKVGRCTPMHEVTEEPDTSPLEQNEREFVKLRECHRKWCLLPLSFQRVAMAHHMGLNMSEDAEVLEQYRSAYGEYAAVVYWTGIEDHFLAEEWSEKRKAAEGKEMAELLVNELNSIWFIL